MDNFVEDEEAWASDEEMAEFIAISDLNNLISDFDKKPTDILSISIWLLCQDIHYKVAENVLQIFINKIRSQDKGRLDNYVKNQRQNITISNLNKLLSDFENKSTFILSKTIWLLCQDYKFDVPENVMQKFLKDVRKQDEGRLDDYVKRNRKKFNKFFKLISTEKELIKEKKGRREISATRRYIELGTLLEKIDGKDRSHDSTARMFQRLHNKYPGWKNK